VSKWNLEGFQRLERGHVGVGLAGMGGTGTETMVYRIQAKLFFFFCNFAENGTEEKKVVVRNEGV